MKFIEQFLEMMAAERGLAKNSLNSYKTDLLDFRDFISKINLPKLSVKG